MSGQNALEPNEPATWCLAILSMPHGRRLNDKLFGLLQYFKLRRQQMPERGWHHDYAERVRLLRLRTV